MCWRTRYVALRQREKEYISHEHSEYIAKEFLKYPYGFALFEKAQKTILDHMKYCEFIWYKVLVNPSLNDAKLKSSEEYTIVIDMMYGLAKADAPLHITGAWKCNFIR